MGLIVPNIKHVEGLSMLEVASEMNRLIDLGMNGKLGRGDLLDCTFSLSNIGTVSSYSAKIY